MCFLRRIIRISEILIPYIIYFENQEASSEEDQTMDEQFWHTETESTAAQRLDELGIF